MNELFGQGTASYVEVRDQFAGDEFIAWLAFVTERDRRDALRKAQEEHDKLISQVKEALN